SSGRVPPTSVRARHDGAERVLERRAGHRLAIRIDLADREVRIRAGLALEDNLLGCGHGRSGSRCCTAESTAARDELARTGEILGRVDAERYAANDGGVDTHAGFERAQLFELLAPLERRRRQRHEPFQS